MPFQIWNQTFRIYFIRILHNLITVWFSRKFALTPVNLSGLLPFLLFSGRLLACADVSSVSYFLCYWPFFASLHADYSFLVSLSKVNLVPRALFTGFGRGAGKGPGIGRSHDHQTPRICGCTKLAYNWGTHRPNVSKYARSVLNSFLSALDAFLVDLQVP